MKIRPRLLVAVGTVAALLSPWIGLETAAAEDECTITDFSPRSAVVGSVPLEVSAGVTTAGDCATLERWTLSVDGVLGTSSDDEGRVYLAPDDNNLAGLHDASASLHGSAAAVDAPTIERQWVDGFSLRRETGWWSFDASPEPAEKGTKLSLEGQLSVADWEFRQELAFADAPVQVEFRTPGGTYVPIKTVQTDSNGSVSTTVTANVSGVWRLRYLGDDTYGPSATPGDSVDVVPPTACTGVETCRVVKSIDVDGDGRKDSVGVVASGLTGDNGKITVRVLRSNGKIVQTTGKKVHWAGDPFIGAAPVDGARGSEILVGDQMGAHYEQFRMITFRKGKLVTAPAPPKAKISNRTSRWGIDSSASSNIGLYRAASKGTTKLTVKTAFPSDGTFSRYTGKNRVYMWKKGKWVRKSTKTRHYTAKQTANLGGLHIKGLPRYGD